LLLRDLHQAPLDALAGGSCQLLDPVAPLDALAEERKYLGFADFAAIEMCLRKELVPDTIFQAADLALKLAAG
jgi:hypothetical protein